MNGEQQRPISPSSLFMVRLWPEALGGSCTELRAEVRHVRSGEIRYFRSLELLMSFLVEKTGESVSQV